MDWIEQLVGISPDGGDGGLERLLAVAATLVLVVLAARLPIVRTRLTALFDRPGQTKTKAGADSAR